MRQDTPGIGDWAKLYALVGIRRMQRRSIEEWSRFSYFPWFSLRERPSRILRARDHYGVPELPDSLFVAAPTPRGGRLGLGYVIPYYLVAAKAFALHLRFPIRDVPWLEDASYNHVFPATNEGWTDTQQDDAFAALRLHGPNPFLLERGGGGTFVADYAPLFEGIHPPVVAVFAATETGFRATRIRVGDTWRAPGDPGWLAAKRRANGLDARWAIFGQHLLFVHLVVAQAFALAARKIPEQHPLSAFFALHTNGTLEVNDFAFRLLLSEASYFFQSGFFDRDKALQLFRRGIERFRFDSWDFHLDVKRRGIDAIQDHPYVEDGALAWEVVRKHTERAVDASYPDDAAVRADPALAAFHVELSALLPSTDDAAANALEGRASLVALLTRMVWNNVVHEISGDFSPYSNANDREQKRLVHWERLMREDDDVRLADVFLFEQGAYAGMFNVGGNNVLTSPLERRVRRSPLRAELCAFREDLRRLDRALESRNASRRWPFLRMQPRQWEFSVSF